MQDDVIILAIESSCDETAVAILRNGQTLLADLVASQIDVHKVFGGVVPEVASRKHLELINALVAEALDTAKLTFADLSAIAVTYGPGLVGALLVGVSTAKALAFAHDLPLIGVHHIEGHIYSNYLSHPEITFPSICLVVSGGHTNIVKVIGHGQYEMLGQTRDDAAGEAFDKVARAMGLGYPGGPKIDAAAKGGDKTAIAFPRAWLDHPYDFSFSGLKSAVLNHLNKEQMQGHPIAVADVAASFQEAVIDVLTTKTIACAQEAGIDTILLAGGVSANSHLREILAAKAAACGKTLYYPSLHYCTDNAAMIGAAAYYKYIGKQFASLRLNAYPQLSFADYIAQGSQGHV